MPCRRGTTGANGICGWYKATTTALTYRKQKPSQTPADGGVASNLNATYYFLTVVVFYCQAVSHLKHWLILNLV